MVRVLLTDSISKSYTGGSVNLNLCFKRKTVNTSIDEKYPGLGSEINNRALSISIDGDIYQDAFIEDLQPDSEITFLPKIGGG